MSMTLLATSALAQTLGGGASVNGTAFLGQPTGALAISTPVPTATDTTISSTFNSNVFATPGMTCVPHAGGATSTAVDNGIDRISPLSHQQIVAGLVPSTSYDCTASVTAGSTVTSAFTVSTTATATPTAITGASYTAPTSVQHVGSCTADADTRYNAISNDGNNYYIVDDTTGDSCSGVPAPPPAGSSNITMSKFNSFSPPVGQTTNFMTGFGAAGAEATYDNLSPKGGSLFPMQGLLFMWVSGQQNACCGLPSGTAAYPETGGNVMMSPDKGATWNNFQHTANFDHAGMPTTAAMFPSGGPTGTMGSCHFVLYGPDDGTLGYTQTVNEVDNANAFAYLICNTGTWNNGNSYYLFRVARAKLQNANAADYQTYIGGDGNLDANWSSTFSSAVAILTNTGKLSWAAIRHIPGRGYLLFTFYYPLGLAPSAPHPENSVWLTYYIGPHLWSTPTLIDTETYPTQGYYGEVPVEGTITGGTSFTVLSTGSFGIGGNYYPFASTFTFTP